MLKTAITILFVGMAASAALGQQPDCSAADARAATAESRTAAEQLRANTCETQRDSLQKEVTDLQGRVGAARQKESALVSEVSAEKKNSAVLAAANADARQRIKTLEANLLAAQNQLTERTNERDAALLKIKRANGKWLCEIFRLGCIKVN